MNNQIKSGYILAGFETLATILNNFSLNKSNRWSNNFSREHIDEFLSSIMSGFLHSFGQGFTGKKNYKNYVQSEANLYKKCRSFGFFNNSNLIVDSGGFQASIGRINFDETNTLIELYHQFVEQHHDVYDRAFCLDLPPGPGCKIFNNFDDVYRLNDQTYNMAKNLPDHVREKMIYINHFRTPKLWEIYKEILNQDGMFEAFSHYGTGGVVANMSGDKHIPCIIYVLPLIPLINKAIEHKRASLDFHILGGSSFRDILFYEFFRKHVLETHGLELNITYDSSGLFKGLMVGRFIMFQKGDVLQKADVRTKNLHTRFDGSVSILEKYRQILNELARKRGFKEIIIDNVYSGENGEGTFYDEVRVYSMLYMLDQFSVMQTMFRDEVERLYPLYQAGQIESFTSEILKLTSKINSGKITTKQRSKSQSLIKSLDMLGSLDEDHCQHVVNQSLGKDEFTSLISKDKIMTF